MILVFETPPYRVDSSDSYWFEVKRTYTGSLSPTDPVEEDV